MNRPPRSRRFPLLPSQSFADSGDEPDPRFSYANERTFLAWIRTSLALVTAGLAITQFLKPFRIQYGRRLIGVPLVVLGAALPVLALWRWAAAESAMRHGEPLPRSRLPWLVAVVIGVIAVGAAVLALGGQQS